MKHLIIGTAGHVDHGKTALIKALTNIDCDTHKQEKERGITINLGFSHLNLPGGESVGIIDVPGHKDFIKTMVAGAFGIDIVMLVVAADSGIMPQTREHFNIIEMLGVEKGIIVLTKADLVDEEMLELATLEISEFLEGTVFEEAPIISVSSITGQGIDVLAGQINDMIVQVEQKETSDFFRLYIDRLFNVKGLGFVVAGTVLNGEVKSGDEVLLLPGKAKKLKIKGLQRHGNTVEKVFAGDRAALNLSGLKGEDFKSGMLLADKALEDTSMVDAVITMFDNDSKIGLWSNVIFYAGTFECIARMHLLDKDVLNPGESAIVQLHLEHPAILLNKDKFIIRNTSNDLTYGGGVIIDINPLHHKKRTEKLLAGLQILADATLKSNQLIDLIKIELIKERQPVTPDYLAAKLNKPESEILTEIKENAGPGIVVYSADARMLLLNDALDREYYDAVVEEIKVWHKKYPILETGLDLKELMGKFKFVSVNTGKVYLEGLMQKIMADGLLKKSGSTWVSSDHEVKLDPKTKAQLEQVENKLGQFTTDRPLMTDIEAWALDMGIKKERLKMLLNFLGSQGRVYFHENEFLYTPVVDRWRNLLLKDLSGKSDGINEKEFRELIGGTKKLTQILLGIFVHEGIVEKKTFYIHITDKGKQLI